MPVARQHGLLVVEDCAQCLTDTLDHGDELADVSLFSFGAIKTATALGGALARVADPRLAAQMRTRQDRWPIQPRREYARRLLRFAGLLALSHPRMYWLFARCLSATGRDLDDTVSHAVRGFPGDALAQLIRRRPSAPLLALLSRRLRRFDGERIEARRGAGDRLAAGLPQDVARPGAGARNPTHWVFPVVSHDRAALISTLRRAGFDAAPATSGIVSISPPSNRPGLHPTRAAQLLASIVFLPAYPELGDRELDRLASTVAGAVGHER
jgi:dTDP-4-amino-4,6-dideoxygalactose transaminase